MDCIFLKKKKTEQPFQIYYIIFNHQKVHRKKNNQDKCQLCRI